MTPRPSLAVLMATYEGAAWLRPQLDSLAAQSRPPDLLLVSDDGSRDGTTRIVDAFAAEAGAPPVTRVSGPGKGAAANFLSLIRQVPDGIDRLSFADQDDIWQAGKLARAEAWLDAAGDEIPVLYCARIAIWHAETGRARPSRVPRRAPSFRNALTQNIATGNTIVLNRAASDLVRAAAARTGTVIVHDWWLYQVVTGAGGRLLFDPEPQVLYRQHGANLIGANSGVIARGRRLHQLWSGTYRHWNAVNLAALAGVRDLLTPENAALVDAFAAARQSGARERVAALLRMGLYRQGWAGQASLYAAAVLGKV